MIKTCIFTFSLFGWGILLASYDWGKEIGDGSLNVVPLVALMLLYVLTGWVAGILMRYIVRRREIARHVMDGVTRELHPVEVDQIQDAVTIAGLVTGLLFAIPICVIHVILAYVPMSSFADVHIRPSWFTVVASFALPLLAGISAAPIVHKKLLTNFSAKSSSRLVRVSSFRRSGTT